jgi:hypothetical protein
MLGLAGFSITTDLITKKNIEIYRFDTPCQNEKKQGAKIQKT